MKRSINNIQNYSQQNKAVISISPRKIYLYLFVFFTIYLEFGYNVVIAGTMQGTTKMIILLLLSFGLFFYRTRLDIRSTIVLLYLLVIITVDMIMSATMGDSLQLMVPILIGYIVATTIEIDDIVHAFSNVVFLLAGYSLVFFLLCYVAPSIIARLPFVGYVYETQAEIHNAGLCVCSLNANSIRNYGIAWEPGAFAILLCVSLFLELFVRKDTKAFRAYVLVVAIITTYSTTGYFVLAGIMIAYIICMDDAPKIKKSHIIIIFIVILLYVVFSSSSTVSFVFSKLNGLLGRDRDLQYTTLARVKAITIPWKAFCSNPIFGIGCENFIILNRTQCAGLATNTIMNWFASLGLLMGVPCVLYFFALVHNISKKSSLPLLGEFFVCISSVLLLSTQSLFRISIVYVFVFYGAKNVRENRKIRAKDTTIK